ncbi:hypothetical protein Btru_015448 [Bulinus truncatus]|nr:hypothetical protein Btru_015448 [Bulinus truncatus]
MSDSEDPQHCHVCSVFEPQAWRKSLCRNCFHSLEEHSEELLAIEAEAVASEKSGVFPLGSKPSADDRGSHTDGTKPKDKILSGKPQTTGAAPDKEVKSKVSSGKEETKASAVAKDAAAGREMPKTKASSTVAMMSGKSKTPAVAASSSPSKSPPKTTSSTSSSSTSTSATTASPSSSVSATSSSATASTTAQKNPVSLAKNFASKFESKASASPKDKPPSKFSDTRGGGGSVSVATGKLSTDSKAESKLASPPKSQDSKQTDSTKAPDSKSTDSSKSTPQKTDTKTLKQEEAVVTEASASNKPATDSKSNSSLGKEETGKNVDDKGKASLSDWKEKKTLTSVNRSDEKDTKSAMTSRSKAAPFSKDMLKSKKDAIKKEPSPVKELFDAKSKDNGVSKVKPPSPKSLSTPDRDKTSPLSKVASGKLFDDKTKKNGDNSTIKARQSDTGGQPVPNAQEPKLSPLASRSSQGPEQTDSPAGVNKSGQQAKLATGKTNDSRASEQASGTDRQSDDVTDSSQNNKKDISLKTSPTKSERDKSSPYRDRGKDEVSTTSKKVDFLSPSSEKLPSTSPSKLSPPSSSKSISKLSTDKLKDASKETKPGVLGKLKESEKVQEKSTTSTKTSQPEKQNGPSDSSSKKVSERPSEVVDSDITKKLTEELKEKAEALSRLNKQLATMEEQMKALEQEKEKVRKESAQSVKDDLEKLMKELRSQICDLESHCSKLEKDNRDLIEKLREMDSKKIPGKEKKTVDNSVLEEDLEAAEKELEEVKEDNKELQRLVMEMRNEMDEMYDHFRESEHDEFRELQKELDMTAKNCRILQFKLRKAERRNDQIEEDRIHYEEKLRKLQDKFDSQDAKNHIRLLEEELRMAKEVSVRLHDELDIIEDKKSKALEESRHLTELLEHTDKRQFRMEMEIDKLRDLVLKSHGDLPSLMVISQVSW